MKLVIQTQYKENYAAHDEDYVHGVSEPYWKFKGGSTYVVPSYEFGSVEATQNDVDNLEAEICFSNECAEEYVLGWSIREDNSRVCKDWETPTIMVDRKKRLATGYKTIRTKMKTVLAKAIVAISVIVLFLTVSAMDYRDKVAEEKHYAHMVCNGHWPDYANIEPDCKTL